ncbi:uncharacterized protein PHACADRAFT_257075 [Phanerochaete carnosa HHB-10118-sp]|uniref:Uncharacterized protein n=1 Tax=Phanerochaete carnosa (strain HHB-10118-sp) TaxID=650164 RepID=K5V0N6_PHACS|nr:uncharacterized protein PHACADRAFT_257075 [Phanerochaete carnosa HHB-10118-sp]EKM56041.1 hypothetical protein PHACADRAFT_257075 [Phanerochaete carnosa HHB-10118-sp]
MPHIAPYADSAAIADRLASSIQFPAPPRRASDSVPEIGGSPAGFIILIVVLSAIFLISSAGVFVLLRAHRDDPYERHARRVLSGRREDVARQMPLGPPGLREKLKGLFQGRGRRGGWVRASSGDDAWDASEPAARGAPYDPPSGPLPKSNFGVHKSDTMESVELAAPTLKDVALPTLSYDDPYSSSPPPLERSAGRSSPGRRSVSDDDEGPFDAIPADRVPRTFENGTRFKESL